MANLLHTSERKRSPEKLYLLFRSVTIRLLSLVRIQSVDRKLYSSRIIVKLYRQPTTGRVPRKSSTPSIPGSAKQEKQIKGVGCVRAPTPAERSNGPRVVDSNLALRVKRQVFFLLDYFRPSSSARPISQVRSDFLPENVFPHLIENIGSFCMC